MPYARAPIVILILLALTPLAFWPAYWGRLATAPWAFHLHGVTASIWLLLLAAQAATIHRRRWAWHRLAGRASLGFFPVYLAGMAGVFHSMAAAIPTDRFYAIYGSRLGLIDLIAAGMVAWLYHRALATRRDPHAHAHAMMATPLFLLSPIVGRLVGQHFPPLAIHGPAEFWKFGWAVQVGNLAALAAALWLFRRAARGGRPLLVSGAAVAVQMLLFPVIDAVPGWRAAFVAVGGVPDIVLLPAVTALGAALVWHGWVAGKPVVRRPVAAAT